MDGIAAEANVGKQTIYRWWSSKAAVVLEALRENARVEIETADCGSLERDLEYFFNSTFAVARRRRGIDQVLRAMMAEAQYDVEFAKEFRRYVIEPRRAVLFDILERGRARGEVGPDANPTLLVDAAFGVMWYRLLADVGAINERLAKELAILLAKGCE
jgi:AcrR family transcriptional regulator